VRADSDRVEEALIDRYAKRNSDLDMSFNDYVKASLDKPEKTIIRWLPKPKFERDADFWKTAKHLLSRSLFKRPSVPEDVCEIICS
jgi:hypothetical protein